MATLTFPKGRATVQVKGLDGKRRSIRLGKVSRRDAESFRNRLARLESATRIGEPADGETARWVAGLSDELHGKLAGVGLVAGRLNITLTEFVASWIDTKKASVAHSTVQTYQRAECHALAYFDPCGALRSITAQDAVAFRAWLIETRKLSADSTARKTISICRQWFADAKRQGMIDANPFEGMAGSVKPNKAKERFITVEMSEAILDACPDVWWRLLFGLARWGGLRIPSEVSDLTWDNVDWAKGWFAVNAHKTDARRVPIFPELMPFLRDAFESASEGSVYLLPDELRTHTNPGVQLKRIVRRAGVEVYPRLWQNLRSTRETELVEAYSIHKACAWIGNSASVALKHYLQVRDEDFAAAAGLIQAVQNPVQPCAADSSKAAQRKTALDSQAVNGKTVSGGLPEFAETCGSHENGLSRPTGT